MDRQTSKRPNKDIKTKLCPKNRMKRRKKMILLLVIHHCIIKYHKLSGLRQNIYYLRVFNGSRI